MALKMTPSGFPKKPDSFTQNNDSSATIYFICVDASVDDLGDIVDEPERNESAVSNQGEAISIAGIAARLSSDIDRYRVPSQDWGYPAFFP